MRKKKILFFFLVASCILFLLAFNNDSNGLTSKRNSVELYQKMVEANPYFFHPIQHNPYPYRMQLK